MMVAVLFVGAMTLTTKHAAAQQADVTASDIQYAATVRQGSTGQAVLIWQKFLNNYSSANLVADGNFGPLTAAAGKIWQASRSLTADGVFGPMSRTSAVAQINSGVVNPGPGTFPAGCSSASGYSTTTGDPCSTSLPAGCVSTSGYSPTTGDKCDSGSTSGALEGGAGSIVVTQTSTDVENPVIESQSTKVLGFKLEASGSDVSMTNLKLTLENTGAPASPYRLTNYIDSVDIYMGDEKVGSADASDFSKNGYVYTKSVALSDAVVRMGASHKATFYVVLNAVSSIDSANMTGGADPATFDVTVDNYRYTDATGIIIVESDPITETGVTFDSLVNAGDVKLTISKGTGNPVEGTVQISNTGATSDIKMLEFKLKATGSDLSFDQISFATDAVTTPDGPIADMIQGLELRKGSDVLASDPVFYDVGDAVEATTSAVTYTKFLLDDTYTINEGDTDTFVVYAKIADITDFTAGSLKLSLLDTGIAPEDTNGDIVTDFAGSAVGTIQTFSASGAVIDGYNWVVNSTGTMIDFFFTVDNSAGDNNFDVVTADINDEIVAGSTAVVVEGATYITDIKGTVSSYSGDVAVGTPSTKFTVVVGDTTTFRVRYSLGSAVAVPVDSTDNGLWLELKVNSVAGETVPTTKVNSPTATVNL